MAKKSKVAVIGKTVAWPTTSAIIERYPEHARLIGSVITEWTQAEHNLIRLLSSVMQADEEIILPMLYAIESSRTRLDVLTAAFRVLMRDDAAAWEDMDSALADAGKLLTQRNKYAHAFYAITTQDELAMMGLKRDEIIVLPLHDLMHQFERMRALSQRISVTLAYALGLAEAPPPTPPESAGAPPTPPQRSGVRTNP